MNKLALPENMTQSGTPSVVSAFNKFDNASALSVNNFAEEMDINKLAKLKQGQKLNE